MEKVSDILTHGGARRKYHQFRGAGGIAQVLAHHSLPLPPHPRHLLGARALRRVGGPSGGSSSSSSSSSSGSTS
eukprot:6004625-Pyramimonas_sp.AAC.1